MDVFAGLTLVLPILRDISQRLPQPNAGRIELAARMPGGEHREAACFERQIEAVERIAVTCREPRRHRRDILCKRDEFRYEGEVLNR